MVQFWIISIFIIFTRCSTLCFGHDSNSTEVCSSQGSCTSTDTCECFDYDNYGGAECNITRCYGIDITSDLLCGGQGSCNTVDEKHTCDCNEGYGGFECVDVKCYGIYSDNSSYVCSGRGECIEEDVCECTNSDGDMCEIWGCDGVLVTDENVCNGRGICLEETSECINCTEGYTGSFCETGSCYGLFPDEDGVCNNEGTCYGYNYCVCDDPFFGSNCDEWLCYGQNNTAIDVCSGHGDCVGNDDCVCFSDDYHGSECNNFDCFGVVNILDFMTCSSHGLCIDVDTCLCDTGYDGDECEDFSCAGIHWNESDTCGGHGTCYLPNYCVCQGSYFGETKGSPCLYLDCFGYWNIELSVCSGNGECVELDTCECIEGWEGVKCDTPYCDGILDIADNEGNICSGHGECVGYDECVCEGNYGTWNCSTCLPDYQGENCDVLYCDPPLTCTGHGICSGTDCICESHFQGQYCDTCIDQWYGTECDIFCNETIHCSGHGTCSKYMCTCDESTETGYWINGTGAAYDPEDDCDMCVEGWFGVGCTLQMETNFTFSNENDRLYGSIDFYPRTIQTLNYLAIHEDDSAKFGSNPMLRWIDDFQLFEIIFGEGATLLPGDSFRFNLLYIDQFIFPEEVGAGEEEELWFTCYAGAAENPVLPTGDLAGPSVISACDDLTLSSTASSTTDGRGLYFDFSVSQISDLNGILYTSDYGNCSTTLRYEFLLNETGEDYIEGESICVNESSVYEILTERNLANPQFPQAKIFTENLTVGYTYVFTLRVVNEFSLVSELDTFEVYVSSEVVPQIFVSGGSTTRVVGYKATFYTIEGYGMLCGVQIPSTLDAYFTYSWKKIQGAEVTHKVENGGKRVIFSKLDEGGWFSYVGDYTYEFSVASVENPDLFSSMSIPITVVGSDLVAVIEGGNRTVQSPYYMPVDGSGSYDPDGIDYEEGPYYYWSCFNVEMNSFCTDDFLGVDELTSFFRHMLYAGEYLITLRFTKGNREAYSVVHYVVVDDPIDVYVSVSSIPPYVNANEDLVMEGFVELNSEEYDYDSEKALGNIYVNWTLDGEPFPDEYRFTVPGETVLGINADVFTPGEKYIVGFSATWSKSGNASFEVKTEVNVNSPPLPGTFTVSKSATSYGDTGEETQGVGFVDEFDFMALYWKDDQLPLTYTYYYSRVYGSTTDLYVMIPESGQNEIRTRIPKMGGNVTIWVEVKDALGASTFSSADVFLTPIELVEEDDLGNRSAVINSTELINETVIYYVEKAIESQSRGECSAEMSAVNSFFASVGGLSILSMFQTAEIAEMISTGWESCGGDDYFVPSPSSASLSINTASNLLLALNSPQYDEDGNLVETQMDGAVMESLIDSMIDMGDLDASSMTPENVDAISDVCGDLLDGLQGGGVDADSDDTDAMVNQVLDLVSSVSATLASSMVVGQPPTIIVNDVFSIAASVVRDTETVVEYGSVEIGLLDEIKGYTSERRSVGGDSIEVTSVEYTEPPFSASSNLTGPATNIVFGKGGDVIPAFPLTQPLPITLESNISGAPLTDNPREAGDRPFCAWLDSSTNMWVTEGCEMVSYGDTTAECECTEAENHFFSTVYEFAQPDLNVLTTDDFANITQLSVDNMTALIFVCCSAIAYLLITLFFEVFTIVAPRVRAFFVKRYMKGKGKDKYKANLESDLVQGYIMDYIRDNLWLSVFFLPTDEGLFPRSQRITVLYLVYLGVFLINALTYGKDEGNFAQAFFSSIISSILIFPIGIVEWCFSKVDARQNLLSSTKKVRRVMDEEMRERFAKELGLELEQKKNQGGELESEEEQDMGVVERVLRGLSVVLFSIQQMVISLQDWMENSSSFITVSLVVIFFFIVLYYGMVIFCDIGALFYMDWLGELGAVIISALAITTFVLFFLFIFWYNKRKKYIMTLKSGEFVEWSTTQFKIVNVILFSICSMVLFLLLFSCVSMHFMDVMETEYLIPIEICLLVLILSSFLWLWTVFVEPKQKKKKERKNKGAKAQKKDDEEKNNLLPHFFSYPIYIFAYFVAMFFSYLIIIYGIKFDSDPNLVDQESSMSTSGRWLCGSGGGILSDFSLMEPINHIFKVIAIYCIIQMFSRVFLNF